MSGSKSLTNKTVSAIKSSENVFFVSVATAWEISIKQHLGKLKAPDELEEVLESNSFPQLLISRRNGNVAGNLPSYHSDPFDRMLIAKAKVEQLTIITHDVRMEQYGVFILWT